MNDRCCICGQFATHAIDEKGGNPMCSDCWHTDGLFSAWLHVRTAKSLIGMSAVGIFGQIVIFALIGYFYVERHPEFLVLLSAIITAAAGGLWSLLLRDNWRSMRKSQEEYFLARLKGPPMKHGETGWTGVQGTSGSTGYVGVVGKGSTHTNTTATTVAYYNHMHAMGLNLNVTKPRNPKQGDTFIDNKIGVVIYDGKKWLKVTA
jgi:hypothetical protein